MDVGSFFLFIKFKHAGYNNRTAFAVIADIQGLRLTVPSDAYFNQRAILGQNFFTDLPYFFFAYSGAKNKVVELSGRHIATFLGRDVDDENLRIVQSTQNLTATIQNRMSQTDAREDPVCVLVKRHSMEVFKITRNEIRRSPENERFIALGIGSRFVNQSLNNFFSSLGDNGIDDDLILTQQSIEGFLRAKFRLAYNSIENVHCPLSNRYKGFIVISGSQFFAGQLIPISGEVPSKLELVCEPSWITRMKRLLSLILAKKYPFKVYIQ